LAAGEEELEDDEVELGPTLDLDDLPQASRELFRFTVDEIRRIRVALEIPDVWKTRNRHVISGDVAFAMLLRRFSYPSRLCDLQALFGRYKTVISEVINEVAEFLFERWNNLLYCPDHLVDDEIHDWMEAIEDQGSALDKCYGFVLLEQCIDSITKTFPLQLQTIVLFNIRSRFFPLLLSISSFSCEWVYSQDFCHIHTILVVLSAFGRPLCILDVFLNLSSIVTIGMHNYTSVRIVINSPILSIEGISTCMWSGWSTGGVFTRNRFDFTHFRLSTIPI
jgi:hypothetical protein